jgi:peptidoglycan-N-acetylglucosamine deacetylase
MHWIWSLIATLSLGAIRVRGPKEGARLYLTFDDGPHPAHTPALLDLLAEHGAHATFFAVGRDAQRHPELLQRILAEGHTLGNHSMTHAQLPRLAPPAQLEEITLADKVLSTATGKARHPFRPPHGKATPTVLAYSLFGRHPVVLWSLDSLDYKLSVPAVVKRLSDHAIQDGEIVLFHDDGLVAVEALRQLLPQWRSQQWKMEAL